MNVRPSIEWLFWRLTYFPPFVLYSNLLLVESEDYRESGPRSVQLLNLPKSPPRTHWSFLMKRIIITPSDGLGWLDLWHIEHCWLSNAKSYFYIYIKYIWFVNTFCWYILNVPEIIFCIQSNGFKYFYLLLIIC